MTDKKGHKNTTINRQQHTKPMDIPHGGKGEGLQEEHPVLNVLDTSTQRREHRVKREGAGVEHPSSQESFEADKIVKESGKEGGSPSSTQVTGSFGAVNDNKKDPMRASTRARTMSLYEMHAPYMT
jgi:hypothetical protein